jgi:hypothetical protein
VQLAGGAGVRIDLALCLQRIITVDVCAEIGAQQRVEVVWMNF